jgi:hypothetical protein
MQLRWSLILPVIGLILFATVSYRSMRVNRETQNEPSKYYWWSSLRLDTDPLNENPETVKPCQDGEKNCVDWVFRDRWVTPGLLDRLLIFSSLPAFLAGTAIVAGFSKLGIDEVLTFMVSMPILIFCWYYFVGWLIERWRYRRGQATSVQLKIG